MLKRRPCRGLDEAARHCGVLALVQDAQAREFLYRQETVGVIGSPLLVPARIGDRGGGGGHQSGCVTSIQSRRPDASRVSQAAWGNETSSLATTIEPRHTGLRRPCGTKPRRRDQECVAALASCRDHFSHERSA